MKNISVFIIGLSFFLVSLTGMCNTKEGNPSVAASEGPVQNAVTIVSSPELISLATTWANEFGKINPGIKINVSDLENDHSIASGQIQLATNEGIEKSDNNLQWKMAVGRDAVVAIINANNPMMNEINAQGISADELAALVSDPAKSNWKNMITNGQHVPVNYYFIGYENIKENIAAFTGIESSAINGNMVADASEIISTIQKDKFAIGFCRLTDVYDANAKELAQGIQLLPVDKNKNGYVDRFENIYTNAASFTRGVWIGKYPHALCINVYALSASQPTDKNTVAFLTWITTEGQKYLTTNGFSDLASREIKSNLTALAVNTNMEVKTASDNQPFISNIWLAAIVFLGLSAFILVSVLRYGRKQKWDTAHENSLASPAMNEDAIIAPKGLYFDKTHTWAFMEQDGNVKVGIDDFLQHVTGTLSRIIMKNTGEKVRKGDKILTIIREGKQLSIYAPISGIILKQNTSLLSDTSLINSSPYSEGWVYVIEPTYWLREIRFLLMGEKYKEWMDDEFTRLKDFFATIAKPKAPAYPHIILQDGGQIADNILANLEPEVWEEFQIKFINTSK